MNGLFNRVAGEHVGVLPHELKGIRPGLLLGNAARNRLFRNVFRAGSHREALAELTWLEQIARADFIAARRTLEHALGRFALERGTAEGARNAHMRCLLKLFGGSSVFPEKPLEQRRVAPVRLEIVPIGIFRGLKLRYVSQLHQAVNHLNRLMANANGVRRLLPASLPRHARSAICAIEASRRLVGIHRAAAILTLDGEHLFHGLASFVWVAALQRAATPAFAADPHGPNLRAIPDEKASLAKAPLPKRIRAIAPNGQAEHDGVDGMHNGEQAQEQANRGREHANKHAEHDFSDARNANHGTKACAHQEKRACRDKLNNAEKHDANAENPRDRRHTNRGEHRAAAHRAARS